MKHTDLYNKYIELEAIEREELKRAVLAHGGEFRFCTDDGSWIDSIDQPPIVSARNFCWDAMCECYITRVAVDAGGVLVIYGYDLSGKFAENILDYICFGDLGEVIDAIPETGNVTDVTASQKIYEVPLVYLHREDIENAGFTPDVTNDQLEQIAEKICKYMDWQEFGIQMSENIQDACKCLGIPEID